MQDNSSDNNVSEAPATTPEAPRPKKRRGFAAMDPALVKAIAKKGGVAAHAQGTAHEFSAEEARAAGQKGGRSTHAKRRAAKEGV
jgi:general stress protein YciG